MAKTTRQIKTQSSKLFAGEWIAFYADHKAGDCVGFGLSESAAINDCIARNNAFRPD